MPRPPRSTTAHPHAACSAQRAAHHLQHCTHPRTTARYHYYLLEPHFVDSSVSLFDIPIVVALVRILSNGGCRNADKSGGSPQCYSNRHHWGRCIWNCNGLRAEAKARHPRLSDIRPSIRHRRYSPLPADHNHSCLAHQVLGGLIVTLAL
jgi:hypothetical protein